MTRPKARANGEGTVYQRKVDGRWVGKLSLPGEKGRKRVAVYGKTEKEALEKRDELKRRLADNEPLSIEKLTVGQYLSDWLLSKKRGLRPKTYRDYEVLVRVHLKPRLGGILLSRLEPEHIEAAYREMESESVMEHAHRRLVTALSDAVRRRKIRWNPASVARLQEPKAKPGEGRRPQRRKVNPPSVAEVWLLLDTARSEAAKYPTGFYEALHTLYHTGLRRAELLALQWRDVRLEGATLTVRESLWRVEGGWEPGEPKTEASACDMVLYPESVDVLRTLKARQGMAGHDVGPDTYVFRSHDGQFIRPDSLTWAFAKLLKKAGLDGRGYRLHSLRHAHATELLNSGESAVAVQARLRHASYQITVDTYGSGSGKFMQKEMVLRTAGTFQRPAPQTPERLSAGVDAAAAD